MNEINRSVVKELIKWIDGHLTEKIRVDDIAQKSGYSKWHFQRIFHEQTGISLATYIRKRKIQYAAAMLCDKSIPIIDVALHLGYENQQTFTRVFSSIYGVPPAKWRQLNNVKYLHP